MQGMERADILPNLVATVTDIEGMDYRSIASVPSEDDKSLKLVGEGAKIPQTEVKTRETLLSSTSVAECLLHHMRHFAFSVLTSLP